jgi:hypothetical protein
MVTALGPWVRPAVDADQAISRDMGVDLGRLQAGVPEQLLHDAKISSTVE